MPAKRKKIFTQGETLAIIMKLEQGVHPASIARSYSVNESSIHTIQKNADKIKAAVTGTSPDSAKSAIHVPNPLLEKMEKMLSVWLKDQDDKQVPISSFNIREKALQLYQQLEQRTGTSSTTEPFRASKGWLERFRKQQNLQSISTKEKAASPHVLDEPKITASFSGKDFGDEAVETDSPVMQKLCRAYPPPSQDPQESSDQHTIDCSRIIDDRSVAEEAEFPMTVETPDKSPSPAEDPLQPSDQHTIDCSRIKDDRSVAEEAEFPMTVETPDKSPSPAEDPLQPKQIQMQHRNHFTDVMEALACDEAFVDVTLTAEGRAIRAHKLVLSAVSPYFQQVLYDNPCRHPVIIMPYHVEFDQLTHIIEYIYKGEITIAEDRLEPLLKTAKLLQVSGLATSDSAALITENSFSTAPEMNQLPTKSSIVTNHQSCSSGGAVPFISSSKALVPESVSHKVSKPFYSSSVKVRSSSVSLTTPTENTSNRKNIRKMANCPVITRAVESEAVCRSASTTFRGISDVPVNIRRPLSAESSINDSSILEGLSDTEIDIVKEEDDLNEDKEETFEFMYENTSQQASRYDPLRTHQKRSMSHSTLLNSVIIPEGTNFSTPDPFICPYCEEQHIDGRKMKVHLNRMHPFKPKFICGCGRVYVRPIQHQVHTKLCSSSS